MFRTKTRYLSYFFVEKVSGALRFLAAAACENEQFYLMAHLLLSLMHGYGTKEELRLSDSFSLPG